MKFPKRLREIRMMVGMTQKEIAELLDINTRSYQNYEQGVREPNLETLEKLADILKVSMDDLFDREPPKK